VNANRGHHGEGQHHELDVTSPSMPGARLVVIEAEFVLGGFETVFDCPPTAPDFRESLDRGSFGRAHVVKKVRSPSPILRRIRSPRVHNCPSNAAL
jgi:hypothetical protein